jgi:hypothetical protein
MACKESEEYPRRCQQSASNPASHSLASHVLAIEASPIYLRLCAVEACHAREYMRGAKSSHGRGHRFETCHAHQPKRFSDSPDSPSMSANLSASHREWRAVTGLGGR